MKNIIHISSIFIISLISGFNSCLAQGNVQDTIVINQKYAKYNGVKNSIYFELLGNGLVYSVNYDRIYKQKRNRLQSIRLGLSVGTIYTALPFEFNYLKGKKGHYIEKSLGFAFLVTDKRSLSHYYDDFLKAYSTARFGYRYQPNVGGFFFKAGVGVVMPILSLYKSYLSEPRISPDILHSQEYDRAYNEFGALALFNFAFGLSF